GRVARTRNIRRPMRPKPLIPTRIPMSCSLLLQKWISKDTGGRGRSQTKAEEKQGLSILGVARTESGCEAQEAALRPSARQLIRSITDRLLVAARPGLCPGHPP